MTERDIEDRDRHETSGSEAPLPPSEALSEYVIASINSDGVMLNEGTNRVLLTREELVSLVAYVERWK